MTSVGKVLFFCYGDARNASTWSNVPCCFVKALEKRGIAVSCVNIRPSKKVEALWNGTVKRFLNLFWRGNMYYFERSKLAMFLSERKIENALREDESAGLCVFTSFSYFNRFDSRPSLLLCDWTYEILLKDRLHRKPFFFEKWYIDSQRRAIEGASLVVSLFKESAGKMKETCPSANIIWPGINVINNLYEGEVGERLAEAKKNSNVILFVGKPAYLKGAEKLLEAMPEIWKKYPAMELHCVGITSEELGSDDERVRCYGYLRKDIASERDTYYDLMCRARVFCNPTPEWAGYSSTVEAMYFYTPVVISKYEAFLSEFGEDISFGRYCPSGGAAELADIINGIVGNCGYLELCKNAREAVKDYSWDNYVSVLSGYIRI